MTPDEQRLIEDLFNRLSAQAPGMKDRGADQLIQQYLRQNPDAAYMLVQTAIVYEHQIKELQNSLAELEQGAAGGGSSGFLGGLLGGGSGSVPRAGAARAAQAGGPWGSPRAPQSNQAAPAPSAAPAGGGFLRGALATAAGVAGGLLAGDALRGLFGGDQAQASDKAASDTSAADKEAPAGGDHKQDQSQDDAQDADYDSGFDDGIDV